MVSIKLDAETEQRLRKLAAENGQDADELARRLLERCLGTSPPSSAAMPEVASRVSAAETELLQKINRGLPVETWQRYHALMDRRRAETLSSDEHEELQSLTDTVELTHAERMKCVVELAELRGVPVDDLLTELGIGA